MEGNTHAVCINTNAFASLLTGDEQIAAIFGESNAVPISSIVLSELYDGFLGGNRTAEYPLCRSPA